MKEKTEIIILQRPISWQHAYAYRAFAKGKLVKFMTAKAKEYKENLQRQWIEKYGTTSYFGTSHVKMEVNLQLKGKRNIDSDNTIKLISDSLNTLAYDDDSQIVELHVFKKNYDNKDLETDIITINISLI